MKLIFDDPTFSLQLLRAISQTYYKGADIGECLSTAYRIKESDFESWYNEWYKTAKRVHYYAKECLKFGHKISAKEALESSFPPSLLKSIEDGNEKVVNTVIEILMETDSNIKFNIKHGMWTFGIDSPYELLKKSSVFTLKEIASNIHCPTLVLDAEKDDSFPGQPQKVYDALTCPKKYTLFTVDEGSEEHCQSGAPSLSNQRIFDWLDEIFKIYDN